MISEPAESLSVVHLRPGAPVLLTKKQLAHEIGRSERWIELRQREGLPIADTDRYGRRRYLLADVERWMHQDAPPLRSTGDRLADLERQVAELRALIERGRTA